MTTTRITPVARLTMVQVPTVTESRAVPPPLVRSAPRPVGSGGPVALTGVTGEGSAWLVASLRQPSEAAPSAAGSAHLWVASRHVLGIDEQSLHHHRSVAVAHCLDPCRWFIRPSQDRPESRAAPGWKRVGTALPTTYQTAPAARRRLGHRLGRGRPPGFRRRQPRRA